LIGARLLTSPVVSACWSVDPDGTSEPPYASYPYEALTLPVSSMSCDTDECTSWLKVYLSGSAVLPVGVSVIDMRWPNWS
jgi:hypothetical protein